MNQILNTPLEKSKNTFFKLQFLVSTFIILCLLIYISFNSFAMFKQEKISNQLLDNYNISKLYNSNKEASKNFENDLFGIIEIPKIDIYYPVFSTHNDDLLKIAPCKFYGDSPSELGNICIAGHNYNNNLFFSNLSKLDSQDEIFLYDNNGKQYVYMVFSIYEVTPSDLSPVLEYSNLEKILTLITCNNLNSNRIIVKAKQKGF